MACPSFSLSSAIDGGHGVHVATYIMSECKTHAQTAAQIYIHMSLFIIQVNNVRRVTLDAGVHVVRTSPASCIPSNQASPHNFKRREKNAGYTGQGPNTSHPFDSFAQPLHPVAQPPTPSSRKCSCIPTSNVGQRVAASAFPPHPIRPSTAQRQPTSNAATPSNCPHPASSASRPNHLPTPHTNLERPRARPGARSPPQVLRAGYS